MTGVFICLCLLVVLCDTSERLLWQPYSSRHGSFQEPDQITYKLKYCRYTRNLCPASKGSTLAVEFIEYTHPFFPRETLQVCSSAENHTLDNMGSAQLSLCVHFASSTSFRSFPGHPRKRAPERREPERREAERREPLVYGGA